MNTNQPTTKKHTGFAAISPERQREIAGKAGRIAHAMGRAHKFTSEQAREAGRKGGASVSRNRAHMSAIGTKGGKARAANAAATKVSP